MCKFVAELAVKMRTRNCFCILAGSSDVWEFTNSLAVKEHSWFSLGVLRTRSHGGASGKWHSKPWRTSWLPTLWGCSVAYLNQIIKIYFILFCRNRIWSSSEIFPASKMQKSKAAAMTHRCKDTILKPKETSAAWFWLQWPGSEQCSLTKAQNSNIADKISTKTFRYGFFWNCSLLFKCMTGTSPSPFGQTLE